MWTQHVHPAGESSNMPVGMKDQISIYVSVVSVLHCHRCLSIPFTH